jgi:hypothetical protein
MKDTEKITISKKLKIWVQITPVFELNQNIIYQAQSKTLNETSTNEIENNKFKKK